VTEQNSYRQILRSSSIIGGASVINIVIGLLRVKVAAVLLGPAGVGLIGLLQSLMATASTVAALGFGNVGTRQVAEAVGKADNSAVAAVRRTLFWATLVLALLGALVFWWLRDVLAAQVLSDASRADEVGWLAIGVALTVASGSQGALLNGMRRIGDLARISIGSALCSTVIGIGALLIWHEHGMLLFVLGAPIASFLLGHWYVAKLGRVQGPATPLSTLVSQWSVMARLGAAFMVSGLVVTLGQLLLRTLVQRELGAGALGQFQAAWLIGMTYIGFVLAAMGTDYYPRLTAAIHDHATANRLVNEQTEVALLMAGPVFLAMLGLAPWIIELLYSHAFDEAVVILRWQVLGDVLKVTCWPMGFLILAAGDGRTFMMTESLAIGIFVAVSWMGLTLVGIQATGIGFLVMYVIYLPVVYWLARRRTGFHWDKRVIEQLVALMFAAVAVALAGAWSEMAAAIAGVAGALLFGLYGLGRLGAMANLSGPVGRVAGLSRRLMLKMGFQHESGRKVESTENNCTTKKND